MKELKNIAFGLIASGVFLSSFTIYPLQTKAQAGPYDSQSISETPAKMDCPISGESCLEKLGLTDEQMEKLIALDSDYEIKNAQKKAQLLADIKQMALHMTEPKTDKATVLALDEKINSLKAELATARANKMLDAMLVLTEKQKEEIHHHMLMHILNRHPMPDKHHFRHH